MLLACHECWVKCCLRLGYDLILAFCLAFSLSLKKCTYSVTMRLLRSGNLSNLLVCF